MAKNLVIVESPAKAKTIVKYLGNDFEVKASMGHIRDLPQKTLGVDVEKNFQPRYVTDTKKKAVVQQLKESAKAAEQIYLASDHDREGEAIAWHLAHVLRNEIKGKPVHRIVFHEITKTAIKDAVAHPRSIDMKLVEAQQARRILDRLVGFELSPLLWRKIKPALSAGRVQSVAVRLIVEREKKIKEFSADSWYRVQAWFTVQDGDNTIELKAEAPTKYASKEEAQALLQECANATFSIDDIATKPGFKNPSPPFTTSTLQQEASRRLGFSVSRTMRIAQQLYEAGKITYMRTDSVNLSALALGMAKEVIAEKYGENYLHTRQFANKAKGAQEAHEAIRPTDLHKAEVSGDAAEKRLYELIWKRTVASQMAAAKLERTTVSISTAKRAGLLTAKGEVVVFDGFLRIYRDGKAPADAGTLLPPLSVGQNLPLIKMEADQRFSQPPARFTEASLVRKLEELGIGRPSTYAPTISTIQKRQYVEKKDKPGTKRKFAMLRLQDGSLSESVETETVGAEKAKLFPTDVGGLVNDFLMEYFDNVLDYNFTALVEKEFDDIAEGNMEWHAMLQEFYFPFHTKVETTQEQAKKFKGEKLLGEDPATGKPVFVKLGRFGPMVQLGATEDEEKPRFASLPTGKTMDDVVLSDVVDLFKLPRTLGEFEGDEVVVASGRFGPYIKCNKANYSLQKSDDPFTIDLQTAITRIQEKREADKKKVIASFDDGKVQVLNGRYGPYLVVKGDNYRIPKGTDPTSLDLASCLKIAEEGTPTNKRRRKKKK
jgi:DNA topoisomerase-1